MTYKAHTIESNCTVGPTALLQLQQQFLICNKRSISGRRCKTKTNFCVKTMSIIIQFDPKRHRPVCLSTFFQYWHFCRRMQF
jgi:hypothetical protein